MFGGAYAAVFNPFAAAQLRGEAQTSNGVPTWSEINKHIPQAHEQMIKGDVGKLFGVQLLESPIVAAVAAVSTGVSGYQNIVLGKDAIGTLALDSINADVIMKTPGDQDTSQPMNQYSTIGWKVQGAFKLLDGNRCVKYYTYKA